MEKYKGLEPFESYQDLLSLIIHSKLGIYASSGFLFNVYVRKLGGLLLPNISFSSFMIPIGISSTTIWDHSHDLHRLLYSFYFQECLLTNN